MEGRRLNKPAGIMRFWPRRLWIVDVGFWRETIKAWSFHLREDGSQTQTNTMAGGNLPPARWGARPTSKALFCSPTMMNRSPLDSIGRRPVARCFVKTSSQQWNWRWRSAAYVMNNNRKPLKFHAKTNTLLPLPTSITRCNSIFCLIFLILEERSFARSLGHHLAARLVSVGYQITIKSHNDCDCCGAWPPSGAPRCWSNLTDLARVECGQTGECNFDPTPDSTLN